MAVIIVGAIIVELPEIFKKNKKLNKLYRGYFVNIGIVITLVAGILAPLSPQPRIDESLRIIFIAIGTLFTALGVYLMAAPSIPLLKAIGVEQMPKDKLVSAGIYSRIRHPIYAGCVIGQIGLSMVLGAVYTLFIMPIFDFLVCLAIVKFFEEPMLIRLFGKEYRQYKERVPAFFPLPLRVGLVLLAIAVIVLTSVGSIPIR
jgi:protein-S-isoprenylcysteine O-methyltransferase Ste14